MQTKQLLVYVHPDENSMGLKWKVDVRKGLSIRTVRSYLSHIHAHQLALELANNPGRCEKFYDQSVNRERFLAESSPVTSGGSIGDAVQTQSA